MKLLTKSIRNLVVEGDCTSVMRSLPGNCVDLIVTDPPYLVSLSDISTYGTD